MLSRISKMGVFGILALMLTFGLAGADALAAKGTFTVSQTTTANGIRAAETVNLVL